MRLRLSCGLLTDAPKTKVHKTMIPRLTPAQSKRFFAKVIPQSSGCWEWVGAKVRKGYGAFAYNGKTAVTHRLSYRIFKGPIPTGLHVLHSCDNPSCVNPSHLRAGTHAENMQDMLDRNRQNKGEAQHCAKLTEDKVHAIRSKSIKGYSQRYLAKEYGVSQNQIWKVVNRHTWAHV